LHENAVDSLVDSGVVQLLQNLFSNTAKLKMQRTQKKKRKRKKRQRKKRKRWEKNSRFLRICVL